MSAHRLRDERERRGIGIDEIEAETRIRAKFLLALEEERFDALPGPAYVRAFVRDYAEQLGLDPQELVAELNTRPDLVADVVMTPPRQVAPVPLLDRRARIAAWVLAAVLVAVLIAIAILLLGSRGASSGGGAQAGRTRPAPPAPAPGRTPPRAVDRDDGPRGAGASGRVQFAARTGSVWLSVREGRRPAGALPEHAPRAQRALRGGACGCASARPGTWASRPPGTAGGALHATGDMLVTAAGARPAA